MSRDLKGPEGRTFDLIRDLKGPEVRYVDLQYLKMENKFEKQYWTKYAKNNVLNNMQPLYFLLTGP